MGNINIEIDEDLHHKLRVFCAEEITEIKDVVPLAIEQYLINKGKKIKRK
jgi:hypothetical protein